jgi:hypothetical protein
MRSLIPFRSVFVMITLLAVSGAAMAAPGVMPKLYASNDDAAIVNDLASQLADVALVDGEKLVFLFDRQVFSYGQEGTTEHRDIAILVGQGGGAEQVLPLAWDSETTEILVWSLRADGTLVRHDPASVQRETDEVSGRVSLILADPDAATGDVFGYSVASTFKNPVSMRTVHIAREHRVIKRHVRAITPEMMTTRLSIRNSTPGDLVQVLRKSHGQPTDSSADFTNIPASIEVPYGRPAVQREPLLDIELRGQYIAPADLWFLSDSWDAVGVMVDGMATGITTEMTLTTSIAKKAIGDATDERLKFRKLQRFIGKQMTLLPDSDDGGPGSTPDDILERRAGDHNELTMVLYAMAKAVDLNVTLVLARDRREGPLDDAFPSAYQFTDMLVRLNGEVPLYLTHDNRYPAGVLPFRLMGAPAATAVAGAAEGAQKAYMDAVINKKPKVDFGPIPLLTLFALPGNPLVDERSRFTETVTFNKDGGAKLSLTAIGETDLYLEYRNSPDADARLGEYATRRFGDTTVSGCKAGKPKSATNPMHLVMYGAAEFTSVIPDAEGETWTIPAEVVFGSVTADGWSLADGHVFHVDGNHSVTRTWKHPLPKGWKKVQKIEPLTIAASEMVFTATVEVEDKQLIVSRTVEFRSCDLEPEQSRQFVAALSQVREYENAPLVVTKR